MKSLRGHNLRRLKDLRGKGWDKVSKIGAIVAGTSFALALVIFLMALAGVMWEGLYADVDTRVGVYLTYGAMIVTALLAMIAMAYVHLRRVARPISDLLYATGAMVVISIFLVGNCLSNAIATNWVTVGLAALVIFVVLLVTGVLMGWRPEAEQKSYDEHNSIHVLLLTLIFVMGVMVGVFGVLAASFELNARKDVSYSSENMEYDRAMDTVLTSFVNAHLADAYGTAAVTEMIDHGMTDDGNFFIKYAFERVEDGKVISVTTTMYFWWDDEKENYSYAFGYED